MFVREKGEEIVRSKSIKKQALRNSERNTCQVRRFRMFHQRMSQQIWFSWKKFLACRTSLHDIIGKKIKNFLSVCLEMKWYNTNQYIIYAMRCRKGYNKLANSLFRQLIIYKHILFTWKHCVHVKFYIILLISTWILSALTWEDWAVSQSNENREARTCLQMKTNLGVKCAIPFYSTQKL